MVRHIGKLGLFSLMLFLPLFSGEETITLDEAVSRALKSNPEILRAQKEVEAAQGRRLQLGALPNPELVFSREGISSGSSPGDKETSLGVEQLIEFPGKRALRREAAGYEEEVLGWELARMKLAMTAEVKKAFFRAAYAQEIVRNTESLLGVLKQYQEIATIRFEAGQVSSLDILRGRLESLRIQGELIEARRNLRGHLDSLRLLMGETGAEPFLVAADLRFRPLAKDLEALKREAEARPSLKAAGFRLEQAKTAVRLAQKNVWPDFKVGLYYPSLRSSAWGFSVGAEIPLWRGKIRGEILEAEALNQAISASAESRRQKIFAFLQTTYADVRASEEQLALFEKSLLREVENMLQLGIAQYQYGKIDSLELFDLYRLFKSTRIEYLNALLAHDISLAELEVAGEGE